VLPLDVQTDLNQGNQYIFFGDSIHANLYSLVYYLYTPNYEYIFFIDFLLKMRN